MTGGKRADETPGTLRVVGTRPPRLDGIDKVTGRAIFGPDVRVPGMIHGKVLRSPHAHARIRAIDTKHAETAPGVYAVITARDLVGADMFAAGPGDSPDGRSFLLDNCLACSKALYEGHAIAAVAATSEHLAEEAIGLIEVDYEVLKPVTGVCEAAEPGAPLLHPHLRTRSLLGDGTSPTNVASHIRQMKGDPATGFQEADVVIERTFTTETIHQGYIEPHAATALWSVDGALTVWTTTQGAFSVRDQLAALLSHPLSKIRVVPTEVGGAFGGKNVAYLPALAALLSRKSGHPVKMVMTRAEVFLGTGPTSATHIRVKMGATEKGRLTAASAVLYYEAGAYPGSPVGSGAGSMFAAYDIPNAQIDGYDVVVNKPKSGSYRAPGATPAVFACEQVVDELAQRIDMDPLRFRRINAATEGTHRVGGGRHGVIGSLEVLNAVRDHPHYRAPLGGAHRGRGIAIGCWGNWGAQSSASINVNYDGTLNLLTGSVDLSGTRTSIAMQAAESLGLPLAAFRSSVGDTDSVGYTEVSAGSRTTFATGLAAIEAARSVVAQMCERASLLWGVSAESVTYADGVFTDSYRRQTVTFQELAGELSKTGGPVTGVGNVDAQGWGGSYGAHITDVEVDPETGKVTILRYTVIQDAGRAIHPTQVEGQMKGGAVMGIGWALYEGYRYDDAGNMLNPNLLDYKLPTTLDVPTIDTVIIEVPSPNHPYGVRGVGENPVMIPPAALANAIARAVGRRMDRLPMTPALILERTGVIEE